MTFSIYSINAQGLKNSKSRYNLIKFITSVKPSVVCVQETNINTISDIKLIIPNYLCFFNSASTLGSGTVIYVSQQFQVTDTRTVVSGKIQYLIIKLPYNNPILIFNVHMSHNDREAINFVDSIESVIRNLDSHDVILAGDWNYVDDIIWIEKMEQATETSCGSV